MAVTDVNELSKVKKGLEALKVDGAVVQSDVRRTHASLHRHLAKMYLWWRDAKLLDGYLDAEYATIPTKRPFKSIKYGINYRPLLYVVYGINNGLNKNNLNNWTLALNAVHKQFEEHPNLYAKDGVEKLASFIEGKGGVDGVVKWFKGIAEVDAEDELELPAIDRKKQLDLQKLVYQLLLAEANIFNKMQPLPTLDFPRYLHTDEENNGLLLVKKSGGKVKLVSSRVPQRLIEDLLVADYRQRFEAQHPVIRPLLELLQTQCLPKHLAKLSKDLTSKSNLAEWGKKLFHSARRVLFLHDTGEFVLSPMNADSGVVSIVKPFEKILTASQDLVVQAVDRARVEALCLREFDFNLYDVGRTKEIQKFHESGSASHVLVLKHRADRLRNLTVSFWPFYDSFPQPQFQLIVSPKYTMKPLWQNELGRDWLEEIAAEFAEPWLADTGKQIKRDPYSLMRLVFDEEEIGIDHGYWNGQFKWERRFKTNAKATSAGATLGLFMSKDLVPVLRGISLLPVAGFVAFKFDGEVLHISFNTDVCGGAKHDIFVPTTDAAGKRSEVAFQKFQPASVVDESVVLTADEYDLEEVSAS